MYFCVSWFFALIDFDCHEVLIQYRTFFYGSPSLRSQSGFRIVKDALGAFNGDERTFNLTGQEGPGNPKTMHSWEEFRVLKIYSEQTDKLLAYAQLGPDDESLTPRNDAPLMTLPWMLLSIALVIVQNF
jgi:hypothetical protein